MALRRPLTPALGLSLLSVVTLLGVLAVGTAAVAGVLALAVVAVLLSRADWALAAAVGVPVLVEQQVDWGPSALPARVYEFVPGTKLDLVEALVLIALAAVVLERQALRVPFRSPGVMTAPLGLLALALLSGVVTGYDGGAGLGDLFAALRTALPLLLVPLVIVQVVGGRVPLRQALGFMLVLAAAKGVLGILALLTGQTATSVGDQPLTYYDAPPNALVMFALLFCAAAGLRRLPLPPWVWVVAPVMTACLLFSYRRSFWIATVLGLLLVVLFTLGRQSRRLAFPAVLAVGVAVAVALGSGSGPGGSLLPSASQTKSDSAFGSRLQSLNPQAVARSKDDRYRIGERRNVLAELRESPVAGLGLGAGYRQRYPLSITDISRDYVHFAALWWWMRTGLLGLVGYLALMGMAVWAGVRIHRDHPDPLVGAAGLAAAAGFVGFAVAETTATFSGPDTRSSILVGAFVGLLAVGVREARDAPRPAA